VTTADRTLTWAAGFTAAGLAVEVAASLAIHPLAFVAFLTLACPLVLLGMGLFVWRIVGGR
jgi:hypothetical protein